MKALTVRQPWAWAIAMGHKPIENRDWTTPYRGPLAIHAASRWDDAGADALREVVRIMRQLGLTYPRNLAADEPHSGLGKVIAVVDLLGICPGGQCDCGPWAQPASRHWRLADPHRLATPVPARGHLGLWDIPQADVVRGLMAA
jgi:hypothetical protein